MGKAQTSVKASKGVHHPIQIMHCGCSSEYQDGRYGKNMRVHNPGKDGKAHTCTVCGVRK